MRANRWLLFLTLLLISNGLAAAKTKTVQPEIDRSQLPPRPNRAAVFFYRASEWVDNFLMKDIDSTYIALPEHSWRLAFTSSMVGINSSFEAKDVTWGPLNIGDLYILQKTSPSVNLGFHAGYRGFGFGYSWDVRSAYSRNMNFSLGGKRFGFEFMQQSSYNLTGVWGVKDYLVPIDKEAVNSIKNTSLYIWYALNSTHYSHNAAVKQSYIQKKTAGSLLLQLAYTSTDVNIDRDYAALFSRVQSIETDQVGVGLGYGFNYTPNQGKVLLHLCGMAQLICFSRNLITEQQFDSTGTYVAAELFQISSRHPVHVTGTVRAAVSWEINKWVHLNAWAQGNNTRFMAVAAGSDINLTNWNWQVNLAIAVRLGAGYERRQKILDAEEDYLLAEEQEILREAAKVHILNNASDSVLIARAADIQELNAMADSIAALKRQQAEEQAQQLKAQSAKKKRHLRRKPLPNWLTDFFFSPLP